MRELKGEKDLQLAKNVLVEFETKHYPNLQAYNDINEGLYWFEAEDEYYSADLGHLLRGEVEGVRIFESDLEDGWFSELEDMPGWVLTAYVQYGGRLYFFLT